MGPFRSPILITGKHAHTTELQTLVVCVIMESTTSGINVQNLNIYSAKTIMIIYDITRSIEYVNV